MTPVKILVFNVGHGDHIVLELPNGKFGIIDSHYHNAINFPRNTPPGLTYIKKRRTTSAPIRLAFLHLTHFHRDHYKGLDVWIDWIEKENIELDYLFLPGSDSPLSLAKAIVKAFESGDFFGPFKDDDLRQYRNKLRTLKADSKSGAIYKVNTLEEKLAQIEGQKKVKYIDGQELVCELSTIEDSPVVEIYSLGPDKSRTRKISRLSIRDLLLSVLKEEHSSHINQNYISSVLYFRYGRKSILFGGDAEKDNLEECINEFHSKKALSKHWQTDLSFDFVKVFHHGSEYSSTSLVWETFLREECPVNLAITAGKDNQFGHPRPKTINDIQAAAKKMNIKLQAYCTSEQQHFPNQPSIAEVYITWPKRTSRKHAVTNKRQARVRSFMPGGSKYKIEEHQFLAYQFECYPDEREISVKKLMIR